MAWKLASSLKPGTCDGLGWHYLPPRRHPITCAAKGSAPLALAALYHAPSRHSHWNGNRYVPELSSHNNWSGCAGGGGPTSNSARRYSRVAIVR
jgi:hypothetical protein